MTRIVNNCVALVCLCLFWGQSLRAADASHSEQIKWGNESVFNEEHNTLGLFSGVLGGQIVLAGALPTIIADGEEMRYAFLKMPDSLCMKICCPSRWLMALP